MKAYKCIECGRFREVEDKIIIVICPGCLVGMKQIKTLKLGKSSSNKFNGGKNGNNKR